MIELPNARSTGPHSPNQFENVSSDRPQFSVIATTTLIPSSEKLSEIQFCGCFSECNQFFRMLCLYYLHFDKKCSCVIDGPNKPYIKMNTNIKQ